jgi:hypothetical protein
LERQFVPDPSTRFPILLFPYAIYDLSFTTDSVVYTLTIVGYSSGGGSISVLNQFGSALFQDSVLTNTVTVLIQSGRGIPAKCILSQTNYT